MALPKSSFLRGLPDWLHWPRTKVARASLLCLGVSILLRVLTWFKFIHNSSFWMNLSQYAGLFLAILILFRWMTRKLLWRLRNRLVVVYLFVGLAPVILLVLLAGLSAYVFAGQ